ncbi:MAG: hypothetical protein WCC97_01990 [Candidatus Acidiferrales bacterium]
MRKSESVQTITVEIVPQPQRAAPVDAKEMLRKLVEKEVAEIMARRDDFLFQPFLHDNKVANEIRRLQTVPERKAWSVVHNLHGCISCHRKDRGHAGCGMCGECYNRVMGWKRSAIRKSEREYSDDQSASPVDLETLARKALRPTPKPRSRRQR